MAAQADIVDGAPPAESGDPLHAQAGRLLLRRYDQAAIALCLALLLLAGLTLALRVRTEMDSLWAGMQGVASNAANQQAWANLRREDKLRSIVRRMETEFRTLPAGERVTAPATIIAERTGGGPLAGIYRRRQDRLGFVETAEAADRDAARSDRELAAAWKVAEQVYGDFADDETLKDLLYVSRDGRFIVHAGAHAKPIAQSMVQWMSDQNFTTVGQAIDHLRPFMMPDRAIRALEAGQFHWRPHQRGDEVLGRISTLTGGVRDGERLVGVIVLAFKANDVVPLQSVRPTVGKLMLVEDGEFVVAESGRPAEEIEIEEPLDPTVKPGTALALEQPGHFVRSAGYRFMAKPLITYSDFAIVLAARERDVRAFVARATWPSIVITLCALIVLMTGLWIARRTFLVPAVTLLESFEQRDGMDLVERLPILWRPWAARIAQTREEGEHYVDTLEQQNQYTTAILASAIDAIICADEEGRITDFNPAAEEIFGWKREEVLGKKLDDTIIPDHFREAHRNGMARFLASGQPRVIGRHVELEGLRRDGTVFPAELALAETRLHDQRLFIGYMRDLSTAKEAEAKLAASRESLHQNEKLAALGQLLAGVSHELNNPLTIVLGRTAMLREKLAGTPHESALEKLHAAADRCGRIVKTFLSMARQSGPRRTLIGVNELVEAALDITSYGLQTAGIEVDVDLAPDLPNSFVDGDQIIQVLINLIVNAQHALESANDRPRRLAISTRREGDRQLSIRVGDSGHGVPADIASRIFEPFFTTKDTGKGTGMGLSVSKGMIEAEGGRLDLVDNGPSGATFRIVVPVRDGSDEVDRLA